MKIVTALLCVFPLLAQVKPLTNQDIIALAQSGATNEKILATLQRSATKLDLSPTGIESLHAANLGGQLIDQLITFNVRLAQVPAFANTGGMLPVADVQGHTVRVGAWIKTADVLNGYAGLWLRVDGPDKKMISLDNSQNRLIDGKPASANNDIRGAVGTSDWTHYQIELPVSTEATNVVFGTIFNGTGTAWFDALSVAIDGALWTSPQFDLDFELPALKGLGKYSPAGYTVSLDNTASYTGNQSLKMQSTSAPLKTTTPPLTNDDIISLTRAGVLTRNILTDIQNTPVKFDVSPAALSTLRAAGVAEPVITQMTPASERVKFANAFGVATGTFPIKAAIGHTIRFGAWIKTDNVQNGYAGPWWRVDGKAPDGKEQAQMLAFDNSRQRIIASQPAPGNGVIRGATGTTGWTLYEFELPVAVGANNINFGILLTGTGTAWADALTVTIDGVPYTDPDFNFEAASAKGFYTGGQGYRVGIDPTTAYNGAQSLRFQFIGDGGASTPVTAPITTASAAK